MVPSSCLGLGSVVMSIGDMRYRGQNLGNLRDNNDTQKAN